MLNMQRFHKLLFTDPNKRDPYLEALIAITKTSAAQLSDLTRELSWQLWSSQNEEPLEA